MAPGRLVSGDQQMSARITLLNIVVAALLLVLLLLPVYTAVTGSAFALTLFTRIVILAIAATSLNLIMGYGGMISFGHAAFIGIGAYAIGILAHEGTTSGLVQWPLAIGVSALFALVVGALSLRTRGVYFIMITLAFAQMVYYVAVGLDRYGGDDGLTIYSRSQFGGLINLADRTVFYYVCLALLIGTVYLTFRLVNSRFGLVIQGSRSNDRRMRAIGFPTFRYRLTCFVIAGAICGLSGALLANHTEFVSPAMMSWLRSGELIVMVVLGGMGALFGPVIGAVALLVLEELLPVLINAVVYILLGRWVPAAGEYWMIILGPMLLLIVLFARGGIAGLLEDLDQWLKRSSVSKG
jgi:branched-chain amino acid transport system permease protein